MRLNLSSNKQNLHVPSSNAGCRLHNIHTSMHHSDVYYDDLLVHGDVCEHVF